MNGQHDESENMRDMIRQGTLGTYLNEFVRSTNSRAAGLWKLVNSHLELMAFGAAIDMPAEVSQGFQDVTRRVSLDENHFGIIRAVNTKQPTIARRDPGDTGLTGSASWHVKFGTESSLAIPVRHPDTGEIIGAIAVATKEVLEETHWVWNRAVKLSEDFGRAIAG
ncbi:MAG: GAF domain-containing protein [Planctomycetes bacterium]|nr:GAF domain-containing protein [Planctomycetota bacterium]